MSLCQTNVKLLRFVILSSNCLQTLAPAVTNGEIGSQETMLLIARHIYIAMGLLFKNYPALPVPCLTSVPALVSGQKQ